MQLLNANGVERRLRLYLNSDRVPRGFRGRRLEVGKEAYERDTSDSSLSRYAWSYRVVCSTFCIKRPRYGESSEEMIADGSKTYSKYTREDVVTWLDYEFPGVQKRMFPLEEISKIDDRIIEVVNRYSEVIKNGFLELIDVAPLRLIEPEKERGIMAGIRSINMMPWVYYLEFAKKAKELIADQAEPIERTALAILHDMYLILFWNRLQGDLREHHQKEYNETGRMLFTRRDQNAWEFLGRHLFEGLTQQIIRDAVLIGNPERRLHQKWVDYYLRLHQRYAFRERLNVNGSDFTIEASPFAEKPVGHPSGNFELAIYPGDLVMSLHMREIADKTFEHADGAVAQASFTIVEKKRRLKALIWEEGQTDLPHLVGRSGREASEKITGFLRDWEQVVFEAVKAVARRLGVEEFYGATPWRIINYYGEGIHPDKVTRIYAKLMARLGGQLVFDDLGELDQIKQHYWRFRV